MSMERHEGGIARVEGKHLARLLDGRLEVALLGCVAERDRARLTLEQQTDSAEAALKGPDRRDRPDRVQILRRHVFAVLPLRDRENPVVRTVDCRFDRAEGPGASGVDRETDARKQDRFPHRNDRQVVRLRHFSLTSFP